ncbi:MAG TPA: hypothetical protein VD999_04965 [Vitreimonas sp.]|nr:hypothetical protein [Vitreimonas sp.]
MTENKHTSTLSQLKNLYPELSKVEVDIFGLALESFQRGVDWVLEKYGLNFNPEINLGKIVGQEGTTGLIETDEGQLFINIDPTDIKHLGDIPSIEAVVVQSETGDYLWLMSMRQWFEGIGVEETVHFAQHHGAGVASLPSNEQRMKPRSGETDSVLYALQPHEFEAEVLTQMFYEHHYSESPSKGLLEYLIGEAASRNIDVGQLLNQINLRFKEKKA